MMNIPSSPVPGSSEKEIEYHNYHLKRLQYAWELIDLIAPSFTLEIGPWTLTHWLRQNSYCVDTLGFDAPQILKRRGDHHFEYNLINLPKNETWPEVNMSYDLVIASEVIEHLPVNMDTIFKFLRSLLCFDGSLIIQTPNGVSLKRRVPIMLGRNPYDHIAETRIHAHMHIREYTIKELIEFGKNNGFEVVHVACKNYFSYTHSWKARLYKVGCDLLPRSFHDGITIQFKKV